MARVEAAIEQSVRDIIPKGLHVTCTMDEDRCTVTLCRGSGRSLWYRKVSITMAELHCDPAKGLDLLRSRILAVLRPKPKPLPRKATDQKEPGVEKGFPLMTNEELIRELSAGNKDTVEKSVTTQAEFEEFESEVRRLWSLVGMSGWQLVVTHRELDENTYANCTSDGIARRIEISLNKKPKECFDVRYLARHEMGHAMLQPLGQYAACRFLTEDELVSAEHEVVMRIISVLNWAMEVECTGELL